MLLRLANPDPLAASLSNSYLGSAMTGDEISNTY
tara:strand:- start:2522 stop:2623 length:102 start_codon:yes stop_codon:yes gene_type:complete